MTVLAAICVGLGACGSPEKPPLVVHSRFIETSDPVLFDAAEVFADELVTSWTPAHDDRWRRDGAAEVVGDALRIPAGEVLELHRDVDLDAAEIHALEVELGRSAHQLELAWSDRSRGFPTTNPDRRIRADPRLEDDGVVRLDLASRPGWNGRIRSLQLRVAVRKGVGPAALGEVRALRSALREDRFAQAVDQAWRVDLGSDARIARIAPPGIDLVRGIDLGEMGSDPRLALAYALQPGVRHGVEFVAEMRRAGSDGWSEILRRRLEVGDAGRWHEEEVRLEGRLPRVTEDGESTAELRLRTEGDADPVHGLPVWGHPEILVREAPASSAPNVALVLLDTLRADRLGSYGNAAPVSPFLDAWAAERAVRFETVVAPSPWTLPSHASLFTGLHAVRHGSNHDEGPPAAYELLAESLRAAGYTTVAITGGGFLRPHFGLDQGFDRFVYFPSTMAEQELERGLDDALEFLRQRGNRRFFLFFHTYEVHYPHRRRPAYDEIAGPRAERDRGIEVKMESAGHEKDTLARWARMWVRRPGHDAWETGLRPEEKELVVDLYDSAVRFADDHVRKLFAALDARSERPTARIVTSDHGEALAEGPQDRAGHLYLEDYNLLVPWLMELPGATSGPLTVRRQVRTVDLPVTLLDYLGGFVDLDGGDETPDGVSLLGLLRRLARRGPDDPADDPSGDGDPLAYAWSYGANSNRGLSLRWDDRTKYVLNDNAWARVKPREVISELRREDRSGEDRPGDLPALRRLALEHLAQKPGLRLRAALAATSAGRLEGRIVSSEHFLTIAKLLSLPARLRNSREPRFSLAPGEEIVLALDTLTADDVVVELDWRGPDGESVEGTADLGRALAESPRNAFVLRDGNWTWSSPETFDPDPELDGLVVWHHGERRRTEAKEADSETIRQLRALGYVD